MPQVAPFDQFEPLRIDTRQRVFVLTGAGISAESGIRTFRDANGLWEQYRFEEVASPEGWAADAALVWRFYGQRRAQAATCAPNPAHHALAALERALGDRLFLCTQNVDDLHSDNNKLNKETALTEKGEVVNGRGDTPNMHDALTGSTPEGRAFPAGEDRTCKNYSSAAQGAVMLGHIDRQGLRDDDASRSWNSSHPSRGPDGGCSQADLKSTGGDGLLYCFAVN